MRVANAMETRTKPFMKCTRTRLSVIPYLLYYLKTLQQSLRTNFAEHGCHSLSVPKLLCIRIPLMEKIYLVQLNSATKKSATGEPHEPYDGLTDL